jgi:hypothetical protein
MSVPGAHPGTLRAMADPAFARLVEFNINDIYESLDVKRSAALDALFRIPARRFARQISDFEARVGTAGLQSSARAMLAKVAGATRVDGAEHIPGSGPVLILSNHPGLSDTLNLFAAIARDDLRVIAAYRPFLAVLPHVSARMVYVKTDASARMAAFRESATLLKHGHCVLTFPAGGIEPDPAQRRDDARASIDKWIDSVGLLAKLAPDTQIVPVIVRGVFDRAAYRNPLAQRKATLAERERFAAMLQVMWPGYQRNAISLRFGAPLSARSLVAQHNGDVAAIMGALRDAARALI